MAHNDRRIPISGNLGGGPPNTRRSTPAYISPAAVDNRARAVPSNTADQRMLDFARRAGSGTTVRPPGDVAAGRVPGGFQVAAPPAFSPEAVRQTPAATVDRYMSPELARIPSIRLGVTDTADTAMLDFAERAGAIQPSIRKSVVDPADTAMLDFAERVGPGTATVPTPVAPPSQYGANPQMNVPAVVDPPSMWGPNPQMPHPADQPAWDAIERVVETEFGPDQSIYNPEYDTGEFPTYDPSVPPVGGGFGGGGNGSGGGNGNGGDGGGSGGGDPAAIIDPNAGAEVSPFDGVGGNLPDLKRRLAHLIFGQSALNRDLERGEIDLERQYNDAWRALPGTFNRRGMLDSGLFQRGGKILDEDYVQALSRFRGDVDEQANLLNLQEWDAEQTYANQGLEGLRNRAKALAEKVSQGGLTGDSSGTLGTTSNDSSGTRRTTSNASSGTRRATSNNEAGLKDTQRPAPSRTPLPNTERSKPQGTPLPQLGPPPEAVTLPHFGPIAPELRTLPHFGPIAPELRTLPRRQPTPPPRTPPESRPVPMPMLESPGPPPVPMPMLESPGPPPAAWNIDDLSTPAPPPPPAPLNDIDRTNLDYFLPAQKGYGATSIAPTALNPSGSASHVISVPWEQTRGPGDPAYQAMVDAAVQRMVENFRRPT